MDVRVLDRPAMSGEAGPDHIWRAVEDEGHEARVAEQFLHGRRERTKRQPITGRKRWRQWSVFGAHPEVATAEDDGKEMANVVVCQGASPREPHFNGRARSHVRTKEARRIIEEYATALREAVLKFRKWFN